MNRWKVRFFHVSFSLRGPFGLVCLQVLTQWFTFECNHRTWFARNTSSCTCRFPKSSSFLPSHRNSANSSSIIINPNSDSENSHLVLLNYLEARFIPKSSENKTSVSTALTNKFVSILSLSVVKHLTSVTQRAADAAAQQQAAPERLLSSAPVKTFDAPSRLNASEL